MTNPLIEQPLSLEQIKELKELREKRERYNAEYESLLSELKQFPEYDNDNIETSEEFVALTKKRDQLHGARLNYGHQLYKKMEEYELQFFSMAERCVVLEEQVASAREDLLRILPGSLNPHLMIGEAIRKLTPTNNTKDNGKG